MSRKIGENSVLVRVIDRVVAGTYRMLVEIIDRESLSVVVAIGVVVR